MEALVREKNALVFTFWCPGEPYKQIDMFLTRENSFDGLVSDARMLTVCGRTVLVASRKKLIEMKRRVEPIRAQDLSDIQALQTIEKTSQSSDSAVVSPGSSLRDAVRSVIWFSTNGFARNVVWISRFTPTWRH